MIITPLDWSLDNALVAIDGDAIRSPGVHLSAIIKDLETKWGRLKGRTDIGPENDEKWHDYRTAGFLIERVFRDLLHDESIIRPGEICVDGIYMTPDYLNTVEWVIEEWKCTWRSVGMERDIEGTFVSWMWQLMAYCRAYGTLHGRLRAFFVNGDYHPRKPLMLAWDVWFTQQELDDNWMMLVNHAKSMGWL